MNFGGLELQPGPLVASFFGAVSLSVILKTRDPWRLASIVLVGMATSLFLGPLMADGISRFGFQHVDYDGLQNAAGYISGLTGMAICNGVIAVVNKIIAARVAAPAPELPATPVPPKEGE